MNFTKKTPNWTLYTIVWILAAFIACYFRLYPLREFKSDSSKEKATVYVLSQIRATAKAQVKQNYPTVLNKEKVTLENKLFNNLLHQEKDKVRETIDQLSKTIDNTNASSETTPYLLASDSFYYYNLTENIVKNGQISDTVKGSKYLNKLMLAPTGHWEPINLHPYIGYYIYKLLKIFNDNTSLMYAVSFTPIVVTIFSLIPFLGICANLRCNPFVALTGATFFSLAPIFIRRSTFGWYDNDPYNTFFPLLITYLFLLCISRITAKERRLRSIAILACAVFLSIMMYAFFWHGWMLMFAIIAASLVSILLYNLLIYKRPIITRRLLLASGLILGGSFIAITIVFGFTQFFVLFQEGWIALKNFLAPQLSLWPDLYISVGELSKSSLEKIITLTGGYLLAFIAGFGTLVCVLNIILIRVHKNFRLWKGLHPFKAIIIIISLLATIIITLGAQRFALLTLGPLCLLFVIGCQSSIHIAQEIVRKFLPENIIIQKITLITLILLITALSIIPIKHISENILNYLNPIYNQTWDKALTHIKNNTPTDSIINTWWSPGHFIKAIAQRRVTFDGASINYPQAYWMSNIYLSPSENEALGYLRMLNNSANQAADYLHEEIGMPVSTAVYVIKQIVKVDELQARVILSKVIKDRNIINTLITMTHTKPPPTYLMIYNEFVEKNVQLGFIGRWNFKKIEEINKNPELLAQVPNRNSKKYVDFLWEMSGGQIKYSGPLAQISKIKNNLIFEENVQVDLVSMHCLISSNTYGKGTPQSIFFEKDNKVIEKKLVGANLNYSVMLSRDNTKYTVTLLDTALAKSTMMQLYLYKGAGFKYIKPFYETSDLTQRTEIQIYKVDWDAYYTDFVNRIKQIQRNRK
ncbi:MAG: hypothetical protein ACI9F2_000098 [Lysobacterales bacterium]|jgi:hypothetical protein